MYLHLGKHNTHNVHQWYRYGPTTTPRTTRSAPRPTTIIENSPDWRTESPHSSTGTACTCLFRPILTYHVPGMFRASHPVNRMLPQVHGQWTDTPPHTEPKHTSFNGLILLYASLVRSILISACLVSFYAWPISTSCPGLSRPSWWTFRLLFFLDAVRSLMEPRSTNPWNYEEVGTNERQVNEVLKSPKKMPLHE